MTASRVNGLVLTVWGAFFWWLIAGGEIFRYIGPRTRWVIWVGALLITLAGLAQLAVSERQASRPHRAQVLRASILLIPFLLLFMVPRPGLGSLAASRKLQTSSFAAATGFSPGAIGSGDVNLPEIEYASTSEKYAATLGVSEGMEVEVTGFVSDPSAVPSGTFALTRFSVFCCAADAIPHTVAVMTADGTSPLLDGWLKVVGVLARVDDRYIIEATEIQVIDEPNNPYL